MLLQHPEAGAAERSFYLTFLKILRDVNRQRSTKSSKTILQWDVTDRYEQVKTQGSSYTTTNAVEMLL